MRCVHIGNVYCSIIYESDKGESFEDQEKDTQSPGNIAGDRGNGPVSALEYRWTYFWKAEVA